MQNLTTPQMPIYFETPLTSDVEFTDRTTVVQVQLEGTNGVGSATAARGDHFVPKIGAGIALGRAIQDLGRQIEQEWLGRVVSEQELAQRRFFKDLSKQRGGSALEAFLRALQPGPDGGIIGGTIVVTIETVTVVETVQEATHDPDTDVAFADYMRDLLGLDMGGEG